MINHIPEFRIDKKAIKAWRLTGLIFGVLWFTPAIAYVPIFVGMNKFDPVVLILIILPSLVFYLFTGLVIPKLRWQRWRYEVNEDAIDLLRGFVFKTRTVVPINRVQHVDTNQGPIYRKYKLSSVKISTAATTHEIPALDDETATEVRNKITQLVRQVKEDV
ncbi:MAG: PH domain-containing protein [Balneola sp.]